MAKTKTNTEVKETVDTITCMSADKDFEFTVTRKFLEVCPNPSEHGFLDLLNKFQFPKYLHNPNGPALVIPEQNMCEYWMDGVPLSEEEAKKIENKVAVKNDIHSIINDQ